MRFKIFYPVSIQDGDRSLVELFDHLCSKLVPIYYKKVSIRWTIRIGAISNAAACMIK